MNATTSLATDLLQQLQQSDGMARIAGQLGLSPDTAQSAVSSALPLMLGALGKNAQQPDNAQALLGALQRDHADSGPDVGSLLGTVLANGSDSNAGGAQTDSAGILGHIFGGNTAQAASGLGQATGLDSGKAGQLLHLLAPIVMGFLAQRFLGGGGGGGADPAQLSQALDQEHQQARSQGGLDALLGSVLDQDGDGKLGVGDLLKLGGGLFGKRS